MGGRVRRGFCWGIVPVIGGVRGASGRQSDQGVATIEEGERERVGV